MFAPRQRETLFRSVARLVRPGGFWVADFTEPGFPPETVEETLPLPFGGELQRKGRYNNHLGCYDQHWETPSGQGLERFRFGHRAAASSLAARTGRRLCLRKAWHPYVPEEAWRNLGEYDEILVDVYQRVGGKAE
ncbi:MAG: hypothetical protein ACRERU_11375 [Methylococcales bacterium]